MKARYPFISRLIALAALLLPASALAQTVVSATLTAVDDGADLWEVSYSLEQDFAHGWGSALTISLPVTTGISPQTLTPTACGWTGAFLFSDAGLLSESGIDRVATENLACPDTPSRDLGTLRFTWIGEGPTPAETHRLVVYDPDFGVVETSTVVVPEPKGAALALAALATLLWLARSSRVREGVVAALAMGLAVSAAAPSGAGEPVEGVITHDYIVGDYQVSLQPTEFRRTGRTTFAYTFDVSATNQGVAAGPAVLSVGTSQSNVSVTDGLIAIPEMAMNETLELAPIEVTINRRHLDQVDNIQRGAFFEPDDVALCVMPEPVPGMALPESDPAIATIDQFTTSCVDLDFENPNWKKGNLPQPPRVEFTQGRRYLWNMLTSEGSMTFELLPEHAAHHVSAIIYLVRLGFYDDLSFHRVVQGFVAQGGDPEETGGGGPGYTLAGEFDPSVSHDGRGVLSTANSGPVSDGSQFFITFAATPHLDGLHTIAGRLVEGADVLTSIEALAAPPTCGSNCAPSSPISITGGSILVE